MKKYLLISCVLFSSLAIGQKKDYISLSFISAFPVGDFKKTETNYVSTIIGYAKRGLGGDLTYVHRNDKSNFGFAATLRARQNKIDTVTFLGDKAYRNPNPFSPPVPYFAWAKDEVKWLLKTVMIGGYYGKSFSNKISFNGKILTGIAKATLPQINWTATAKSPYTGYGEFKRDKATSVCISTCVATGFEFSFTKQISLLVNGEYWYAKPTFQDVNQSLVKSWGGGNNIMQIGGKMIYPIDMSTIDVNIGLALSL